MAESIDAKYSYGGLINIEFQYKKIDDREQPVMVFHGKTDKAYQIPLDCVIKYADPDDPNGSDANLIQTAQTIGALLGLGTERSTVTKIAGLIENHLEELVRMPPTLSAFQREQAKKEAARIHIQNNKASLWVS